MKNNKKPWKNEFFDIKPLKDWTILGFPISMSNISTKQSVGEVSKWIDFFGEKKAGEPKIGLNLTYTDFLYMVSNEPSNKVKEKFMFQIVKYKNGIKNFIHRNRMKNQILHAFHFETWGNLYLESKGDFNEYFKKVKQIYKKDKLFQKYVKEDCMFYGRKRTKSQINFFLEEHLMAYLILNKKINFRNEYVQGREKNILFCYPGVPPKSQVYLINKNPFKFLTDNFFIGQYNLSNKKFYDFENIDLKTYEYK